MRPRIVAGNWKMFTTLKSAGELAAAVVAGVEKISGVEVIICPPFPWLFLVAESIRPSRVQVGAQNCFYKDKGAFTGEVSPTMLIDAGCRYVILGHSERRHILGESDELIARKVEAALESGLRVILCVGETLAERQCSQVNHVLERQVRSALSKLDPGLSSKVIVGYEPVWAIGTGQTAGPPQAQEAHAFIRKLLGEMGSADVPILYGGSVKPDNAADLFAQPDVDGGLIGGASLEPAQFLPIVRAALPRN
jgi:triosephosphate isomerase